MKFLFSTFRPAAKFAENSEEKAAERANHRQRLGFGQSRLQGNSGVGPEGGQRGGKGGGQRGNRERRNKGNRRGGGGNKHPDQVWPLTHSLSMALCRKKDETIDLPQGSMLGKILFFVFPFTNSLRLDIGPLKAFLS